MNTYMDMHGCQLPIAFIECLMCHTCNASEASNKAQGWATIIYASPPSVA